MTKDGLVFTGLGNIQVFESVDSCLRRLLLMGPFDFSADLHCGMAGSVADWESGAPSGEDSSRNFVEGVTS